MAAPYTFDPGQSRFTVQAFATGMLSMLGHNPTFAVRDFSGALHLDGGSARENALELTVPADSLELIDQVKPGDRTEIMERMRRDVLETSSFPEIRYQSTDVASRTTSPGRSQVRIAGQLSLHGVTRPHPIDAELQVLGDTLRLLGSCPLRMSDHRISPVSALGGTIRLKDELTLRFDLIGLRGGS